MKKTLLFVCTLAGSGTISAQISSGQLGGQTLNPITTAVPFLMISPDSKQGAMGDAGAATEPDVNSIHWNGSKLAFAEKKFGVGFTVTPWLRLLVPDINMYYLAGYGKLNDRQTVGASLRYFSLGNIDLTDATGQYTGSYKPNEFAIDLAFSQKLSKNFSLGVAARYINSSISRVYFAGSSGNAASTFAVDLSMFYKSNTLKLGDKKAIATAGLAFTNIGAKISYSNDQNFIPMNMRLGGGLKTHIDDYNTFGVYLDFNKLLVPTPPVYQTTINANGQKEIVIDPATGKRVIAEGKDPNVDVATGIMQSFSDAPGGFHEELQEINTSFGMEYAYNNIFAVRGGYFYESKAKGGRQFFTVGMGFKFKVINVDGSYLIPTSLQNPLQRTWRITLSFNFDGAGSADDAGTEKVQP
ncbi:MAG: type IX secretion system outer membrane channel protein PorV [bacterium]|nr:type IX secretion system outer membrane channel protein PorV [bacterium]